jgi:hypothetical protein
MVSKIVVMRPVFIWVFLMIAGSAGAQPTLPGIAGSVDRGIVILTWNCQYDGIKSISVERSPDSLVNYAAAGNVKKVEKGVQVFVDGHPAPGKSFYRLIIVFKSGLKWGSNYCRVFIDKPSGTAQAHLPANDSLQKFIITQNESPTETVKNHAPAIKEGGQHAIFQGSNNKNSGVKSTKISIIFDADTTNVSLVPIKENVRPPEHKIKIKLSFDDPAASPATFIKPLYVFTDPVTGFVNISLPGNIKGHCYAIGFYDLQNNLVLEAPVISAPNVMMDKRNFQHKALYKFVLRRDGLELESGYVNIN